MLFVAQQPGEDLDSERGDIGMPVGLYGELDQKVVESLAWIAERHQRGGV